MPTNTDHPADLDGMEPYVYLDEEGREIPNPNPIVIYLPGGPVSDFDRVRELIRREMSLEAERAGMETMEEANDFDVDGDMFPVSPHEYAEQTEAADLEALAAEQERQKRAKDAKKGKKGPSASPKDPPEGGGEVADLPDDPAPKEP